MSELPPRTKDNPLTVLEDSVTPPVWSQSTVLWQLVKIAKSNGDDPQKRGDLLVV